MSFKDTNDLSILKSNLTCGDFFTTCSKDGYVIFMSVFIFEFSVTSSKLFI